ncbi:MAG: hypothetical protein KDJ48_09600 [Nitratireductor sp.]|nr:hypothetical protein [Nitratireductor sp.]
MSTQPIGLSMTDEVMEKQANCPKYWHLLVLLMPSALPWALTFMRGI